MHNLDKTTCFVSDINQVDGSLLIIFDSNAIPHTIQLNKFGKDIIYFGREESNDIVLNSLLVSHRHGRFVHINGKWRIEDLDSKNGLIYNNAIVKSKEINDGDLIRIDDGIETIEEGVLFVISSPEAADRWNTLELAGLNRITIGRDEGNLITLSHISVSKNHASIIREKGKYVIVDNNSTNGVLVNGKRIKNRELLHEKDVIEITNSKLIFTSSAISYCCFKSGISVDASDIVVIRKKRKKTFVACNHVNLNIKPGELVAIIGGSGAGKSTILNCMCGYLKPTQGQVYINGVNLYQNFDSLKKLIGYVPQSDIVYDNLTLHDMLMYTAKLRLPKDISVKRKEVLIEQVINMVELSEKKESLIKELSGGQRKRASIAVELLSDPNLLFLDEPASGLDPGTERNLMQLLRKMADDGKTIILVTHSTLQLKVCDKIVFMGKDGNLCFCGSYDEALSFFNVTDVVDTYNMLTDHAEEWRERFDKITIYSEKHRKTKNTLMKSKENKLRQLGVMSARYMKLVINDKKRFLLLLAQAPTLALLISIVADGQQFEQYEMTKSLLFALSCSAFWIGMLNAIQEICKERVILRREYMTGLSLGSYIVSKIIVLGILGLVQSVLVTGVFSFLVGLPQEGIIMHPLAELFLTTFITTVSSTAMGLFVSSLFKNPDRAMTVAPILLMPQILFSGLIFKLDGATEIISWCAVCRWSMEGYGTTANLNSLSLRLQQEGVLIPHEAEEFFEFTTTHLLSSWGILVAFIVIFLILARMILGRVGKESS